ncbi:MAG: AsmA-like C-terminal region-containing protein [Pirellulales bacterium]
MAALAGGVYLYLHLDDQICRHVERLFANHYKTLTVDVGSARYEQGRGIFVNHLSLLERRDDGRSQPMLSVDELFLASDARLDEVLSGKPRVKQIVVRRPRLRAVLQPDGRWNVAVLVPLPKFSDDAPQVSIEDATLLLEDAEHHAVAPLSLRGIDIQLTPAPLAATAPRQAPGTLALKGTVSGAPARELTFSGTIAPEAGTFDLNVEIRGLELSPELIAAVPGRLHQQLGGFELYASADATVRVGRTGSRDAAVSWSATASAARGRLGHPMLPQPVTELAARIEADQSQLAVKQLTGKFGGADILLACNRSGWGAQAPLGLSAKVTNLAIGGELQAVLPARLEQLRQRFQPQGIVDADIQATFDGQQWRPDLTAHCRDMALTDAEKFPYPVEAANGTVSLARSADTGATQLNLDLTGLASGRPIRIVAQLDRLAVPKIPLGAGGTGGAVTFGDEAPSAYQVRQTSAENIVDPTSKPTGWVEVSGSAIAIDPQLLSALPPRAQLFVRSLHPQGLIDFRWRFERLDPAALRGDTSLDLKLVDCAIQYEKFPYPLEQVRGSVTAQNGHYQLTDLVGRDRQGSAVVTLQGEADSDDTGLALALAVRGANIPLDDNLKLALSAQVQQVWSDLRPQGRINFLADIRRALGEEKPVIRVELQPQDKSVSVEPTFFPYRFERVEGRAVVTDGRVDLQQLRGVHGRSLFTANGVWQGAPNGWQLELTNVNADRLTFDTDLLRAAPPNVQKVIDRIRPTGDFNAFNSTFRFLRRPNNPQIASQWDVRLACHQASLRGDLPLGNLTGGIQLKGLNDGANVSAYGELSIDSLIWNDVQFTNLRGPFWTDSTVCYLGRQATAKLAQPPLPITADVFGGTITADVACQHAGQPNYTADLALGAIDLGRFARERLGGPNDLTGIVSGKLALASAGRSIYTLTGKGDLHVVDANIYQLPPLVAMLKMLRNRTPNTTAFNRCDALFDIRGEHIHFNQLNLLGDAVSLYGRGETNFDRRLDLTFYTLVGAFDMPNPLKTMFGHLSEQAAQLKVDGTWDNPQIHREYVPMVNQMLGQIQAGAEQGAAAVTPPAAAGLPWVTPPR